MSDTAAFAPIPHDQAWPARRGLMEALIKKAFQAPINLLEIGVWFGAGSTQIWMDHLKPGSTMMLLDSWKPFSSEEDKQDKKWDYQGMDNMTTEAFLSAFLTIKKFENERGDANVKIQMTRGDSELFLPMLKDGSFDFIYIDGDHKYEKSKNDIMQAKRLVNHDFGVICGDDLEMLPTPELVEIAKQHKTKDYLRAPERLHPGVLLSIAEAFPVVNLVNGFWWVVCQNGKFTTSAITPEDLKND